MELDRYLYTNKGGRSYNEDSADFREEQGHGIYVVADGLRGHRCGDLASQCVVSSLTGCWDAETGQDREEELRRMIADANEKLLDLQREQNCVMKSTVVVLAVDEERAVWANVGDSRLYYLHRNNICAITEDHSVSYKKYKSGEITRSQISRDEDQSSLLRSLGSHDRCEPDICFSQDALEPGDAFLLCSDGAWEYLYDMEILIDFLKADTAQDWAEMLLMRIMARLDAGNDNLTLLTVILQ